MKVFLTATYETVVEFEITEEQSNDRKFLISLFDQNYQDPKDPKVLLEWIDTSIFTEDGYELS